MKRYLQLTAAGVFLLLGMLGVALPILPTTPFLLLASYFLARSSPRLNAVLLNSRMFGPILRDWQERGGVQQHVRVKAITIVLIAVVTTIVVSGYEPVRSIAVSALAVIGIAVVLRLPAAR